MTALNAKLNVLSGGEEQITSPFGTRKDPITGRTSTHNGVDLIGATTAILCPVDGVVQKTRNSYSGSTRDGSAGNFIIVQHKGYDTVYYHLAKDSLLVKKGDRITAGQVIATMGKTGHATGVHLHFGIDIEDKKLGKTGWTDPGKNRCPVCRPTAPPTCRATAATSPRCAGAKRHPTSAATSCCG